MVLQQRADETGPVSESSSISVDSRPEDTSPSARAAIAHARLASLLAAYDSAHEGADTGAQADVAGPVEAGHHDDAHHDDVCQPRPVFAVEVDIAETGEFNEKSDHDTLELENNHASATDDASLDGERIDVAPSGEQHLTDEQLAELSETVTYDDENSDQRFAMRRKTKMKAVITVPGSQDHTACSVADISSTGVLLVLPIEMHTVSRSGEHVPARFTLYMPTQRTEIDCELAWRSGNRIGARFTSALRQIKPEKRVKPAPQATNQSSAGKLVSKLFSR